MKNVKTIEVKSPEAAEKLRKLMANKKAHQERIKKAWSELLEGEDYVMVDTDIDAPYPVKRLQPISQKAKDFLSQKF